MLNLHCVTRYVKVCFLMGRRLDPLPPVPSDHADARYLHIHEDDDLDEAQFAEWVRQATKIPSPPFF